MAAFRRASISKLGRWVPHRLSEKNKADRAMISKQLLERHERGELRLDDIVTSDEKWVLYTNVVRKRSWVDKVGVLRIESRAVKNNASFFSKA